MRGAGWAALLLVLSVATMPVRGAPVGGSASDERLRLMVLDHLEWDDRLGGARIRVVVRDRVVTLEGTVPSYALHAAAERGVLAVQGVRAVENRLEVEPPRVRPADGLIAADVEKRFRWSPDIRESKVSVRASAGIVILEGTVDALWRRSRAEEIAGQVFGVLGVVDRIVVVPTGEADDARLAARVRAALARHRAVSVDDVAVTVANGSVRLSGTVTDQAARRAALEAAVNTAGVREVEDDLAVR